MNCNHYEGIPQVSAVAHAVSMRDSLMYSHEGRTPHYVTPFRYSQEGRALSMFCICIDVLYLCIGMRAAPKL